MTTFSVALAAYNGRAFLEEQLESIAAQTVVPDEIVIGDDCSTDGTADMIAAFARRHPDLQLRFQTNVRRLGSTANFESIVRRCTGDVVVFADQDDVWCSNRVARVAEFFDSQPDVSHVVCDGTLTASDGARLGATLFSALGFGRAEREQYRNGGALHVLLRCNVVTGACLAVRRALLLRLLPIEPDWVHDYYLAFALELFGCGVLLDDPLIRYRRHAAQQIGVALPNVSELIATAQRQTAAYCHRDARRFRALAKRLLALGLAAEHWLLPALESKAQLCDARAGMRTRPFTAPKLIWQSVSSGSYQRFSHGWKQGVVDVVATLYSVPRALGR